jgi:glycosyltransferase involved in cell wall biosynthesis
MSSLISNSIVNPKPRIWFDGTVFCKNFSGEQYSADGILKVLLQYFDVCIFLPKEFASIAKTWEQLYGVRREQIFILTFRARTLLIMRLLGLKAGLPPIEEKDFLWMPSHRIYPKFSRQFCVIHDLMPITAGNYIPLFDRLLFRASLRRISRLGCPVFCHSHYVLKELIEYGGFSVENITVVPLGLSAKQAPAKVPRGFEGADRVVDLLYISAYQVRKNFELLIDHVRRFRSETELNIRLTIAGPGLQKRLGMGDASVVRVFDFISEEKKRKLFDESDIYINPSAAEGFGITNLEAQLHGLPVLCSDIPPFHEVLGESAAYFKCNDFQSFRTELLKIIQQPKYAAELAEKGRVNANSSNYRNNLLNIMVPKVASLFDSHTTSNKLGAS